MACISSYIKQQHSEGQHVYFCQMVTGSTWPDTQQTIMILVNLTQNPVFKRLNVKAAHSDKAGYFWLTHQDNKG